MNINRRKRWYGWYSQKSVEKGSPVFVYKNHKNESFYVTGLTSNYEGRGYFWPDKVPLGDLTYCRFVRYDPSHSYTPHPDLYLYDR